MANTTPTSGNNAEPKQINQLPDVVSPGTQLAGAFIEVETPDPVAPGAPASYTNRRLGMAALAAALSGSTATGNNQKGTQPRIVLYESSTTPGVGAGDSTLDRLSAATLCVGVRALVLSTGLVKELAKDPTGALTVAVDGNFSGPTTQARWVDPTEALASGLAPYSPLKAEYALGAAVSHRINNRLEPFAAVKLLRRVDFPDNTIPPPSGVTGDENWEPIGYQDQQQQYVGFQRVTPQAARLAAEDEQVRQSRLYELIRYDKTTEPATPLPPVQIWGASPTSYHLETAARQLPDGSWEAGSYNLTADTFTPGTTGGGGTAGVSSFNGRTGAVTATKSDVGLGSVDNTSDANKPVSTAQAAALALKSDLVAGKVPASQLPSYVDDVLEYATLAAFPATGETGKMYLATGTNKVYRWSGSAYIQIVASPGSTDEVAEGATNKYFTNARAIGAVLTGYAKAAVGRALTAADSVLVALGILEKRIEVLEDNSLTPEQQVRLAALAAPFHVITSGGNYKNFDTIADAIASGNLQDGTLYLSEALTAPGVSIEGCLIRGEGNYLGSSVNQPVLNIDAVDITDTALSRCTVSSPRYFNCNFGLVTVVGSGTAYDTYFDYGVVVSAGILRIGAGCTGFIASITTAGTGQVIDERGGAGTGSNPFTTDQTAGIQAATGLSAANRVALLADVQALTKQTTLAYAASITLDFSTAPSHLLAASGNVTFAATANKGVGLSKRVLLTNATAGSITVAYPYGWKQVGAALLTSIPAGKGLVLTLESTTATEDGIWAATAPIV